MKTKTIVSSLATATLVLVGLGCATAQPTDHLVDAREHYRQARNGVAQQYEPDLVYDASVALRDAEAMHDRNPGTEQERHLAYIADRKAMLAIAAAEGQVEEANIADASGAREEILTAQRNMARNELDDAHDNLGKTKEELAAEREARLATEAELQAAMDSLEEIASIKAEEKNIVITLSGEVLFKTNEATLLPIAQSKLDKVADVLTKQGDDKEFVVEGHTDSRGDTAYNEKLSLDRANAVRNYLVSQGVPSERIRAEGRGENEPVASNQSPEGRANNRRVEIVVKDEGTKSAQR